eukprot:gene3262-5705_t
MHQYILLLLTSLIWGITNPIIKQNSQIKEKKEGFKLFQIFSNIYFLIPQLINLSGSILFFIVLSKIEIIIAVPVVNSLTFIFTEITSILWLKEKRKDAKRVYFGLVFVILGVTICLY